MVKDILTWTTGKSQCNLRHLHGKLLQEQNQVRAVKGGLVFDTFFTIILDINRGNEYNLRSGCLWPLYNWIHAGRYEWRFEEGKSSEI